MTYISLWLKLCGGKLLSIPELKLSPSHGRTERVG
jgi:hypothetical protein